MRLLRFETESSEQFFSVRLVSAGGQEKVGIRRGLKRPLIWRRRRAGGHGTLVDSESVRMVDCGRRRVTSLWRRLMACLRLGKGIASWTSPRSRLRRLVHFDSAGRLLMLEWSVSYLLVYIYRYTYEKVRVGATNTSRFSLIRPSSLDVRLLELWWTRWLRFNRCTKLPRFSLFFRALIGGLMVSVNLWKETPESTRGLS